MSPLVLVFAFVLVVLGPTAALDWANCKDVFVNFNPCATFVEGMTNSANPSPFCCRSLAALNGIARKQKGGARRICRCIEQYGKYHGRHRKYFEPHIRQLPAKCRISLSFPISENMDCSTL